MCSINLLLIPSFVASSLSGDPRIRTIDFTLYYLSMFLLSLLPCVVTLGIDGEKVCFIVRRLDRIPRPGYYTDIEAPRLGTVASRRRDSTDIEAPQLATNVSRPRGSTDIEAPQLATNAFGVNRTNEEEREEAQIGSTVSQDQDNDSTQLQTSTRVQIEMKNLNSPIEKELTTCTSISNQDEEDLKQLAQNLYNNTEIPKL